MNATQSPTFWQKAKTPAIAVALVGSLFLIGGAVWSVWADLGQSQDAYVYYTAVKGDLPIVVTERGSLDSQVETAIRCEVENSSFDRSGASGTQIIFIVPNGSAAKEGDLLVELDSAAIRERLDQQMLAFERAKSQRIQGQAKYENQKTQNETAEAQANLNVALRKLQLQMYMDEESGTFKLAREEIERAIDDQRNKILETQAALELRRTDMAGIESLFKLGYRGKSDLDQSRMSFMQTEGALASAVNRLSNVEASRLQLENYEFEMQKLSLEGDVATAERSLKQVITDNASDLAQAEAAKIEAETSEKKEKERLDKLELQLTRCKIYAPHDGMVVYARENNRYNSGTEIAEGVTVRERQELIKLPDLSKMEVKTQVHEAVLDQIRPGLPTTVKIDAFPNRNYNGVVSSVAVVPSSSYYTNVKTYECIVRIVENVEQLKPGMTAVVEIHVDRLRDVISVPVQAIVQINQETWCYVDNGSAPVRRDIELGRSNDKFVHVTQGLEPGEQLVLNPMSILDESEKQTGTSISSDAGSSEAPEIPASVIEEATTKKSSGAGRPGGMSREEMTKRMEGRKSKGGGSRTGPPKGGGGKGGPGKEGGGQSRPDSSGE